ncbi:late competence development ComFB family protein [Vibrio sp. TH_r3]|uniref:late competence development ComFB family protein n=1 Tax=Vibrio sp. TH_r3 TaxID=3082084 RepID=UPI002952DF6A|nr:late competence development ComFB family protein [Vibrio sp. TH_r3]MDV7103505.1 late competence development ComFB family protein [Vibrio sp. TH_r3]
MQISVDVHNYMETLVGAILAEDEFITKYSNEQLADLACIALNQLRPVYIRYDIDFLSRLAEERLLIFKQQAQAAIEAAETMITNDRREVREQDDLSLYSVNSNHSSNDRPLEWFEKPILPN